MECSPYFPSQPFVVLTVDQLLGTVVARGTIEQDSHVSINFKLLQNDSETVTIFSQPPLISFKRDRALQVWRQNRTNSRNMPRLISFGPLMFSRTLY